MAVLLALGVAWLNGANEPTSPIYVEELRESLVELARRAGPYEDAVVDVGAVDRVRLSAVSDDALVGLEELRAQIESAPEGTEMAGPLAVLSEAVAAWESGVGEFRAQLIRAADEPDAVGIEVPLTTSLIDLVAGNRLYARFVERYPDSGADTPVTDFPEITFLVDGYPIGGAATQLVELARADDSLIRLHPDVAIDQVVTDPELVLNTDEQLVAVFTTNLSVTVVVVNLGNGTSDPTDLSLELIGPGEVVLQLFETVEPLEPGAKTTVAFDAMEVTPGSSYQLNLTLPLAENEEQSEDNLQSFPFRINEQTTTETTTG